MALKNLKLIGIPMFFSECILSALFKHVIDLWGRWVVGVVGWLGGFATVWLDLWRMGHFGGKPAQVSFGASFRAKVCSAQTSNVARPSRSLSVSPSLSLAEQFSFIFSVFAPLFMFSVGLFVCLPVCLPV